MIKNSCNGSENYKPVTQAACAKEKEKKTLQVRPCNKLSKYNQVMFVLVFLRYKHSSTSEQRKDKKLNKDVTFAVLVS